jgi:hypothetical protein
MVYGFMKTDLLRELGAGKHGMIEGALVLLVRAVPINTKNGID